MDNPTKGNGFYEMVDKPVKCPYTRLKVVNTEQTPLKNPHPVCLKLFTFSTVNFCYGNGINRCTAGGPTGVMAPCATGLPEGVTKGLSDCASRRWLGSK